MVENNTSPYAGQGPGRPRKNPLEKIRRSPKPFYFPISLNYDIVWKEFELMCENTKEAKFYNRNKFFKKGFIIRRLILKYVFEKTKNMKVKDTVHDIIIEENKEHIIKWEADTGKKYKPVPNN